MPGNAAAGLRRPQRGPGGREPGSAGPATLRLAWTSPGARSRGRATLPGRSRGNERALRPLQPYKHGCSEDVFTSAAHKAGPLGRGAGGCVPKEGQSSWGHASVLEGDSWQPLRPSAGSRVTFPSFHITSLNNSVAQGRLWWRSKVMPPAPRRLHGCLWKCLPSSPALAAEDAERKVRGGTTSPSCSLLHRETGLLHHRRQD